MGCWGLLDNPPPQASWEFSSTEYRRRIEGARRRMAELGIICLFLTSENNFRYFTGFHSQTWVSVTRPRYAILPRDSEPVAVVPTSNVPGFRTMSWIADVRSWPAPRPSDDGISLVIDALRGITGAGDRIGVEVGPGTRLAMPVADFLRIRDALTGVDFVDAGPVVRRLQMVKSPAEVDRVRRAAQIASDAFEALAGLIRAGQSEHDLFHLLHRLLVERGVQKVPYLVPVSGAGGYSQLTMGPTERILESGDVVYIDVGATWRGYFCDFNRNFGIGRANDEVRNAYARVFEATEAGLAAIRPGLTAADVWHAMAAVLDPGGSVETPIGRMGHGVGLSLTEPPSIAPDDTTVLEEGMVLTLEPSLVLPSASRSALRLMVHEENIVVTRDGYDLLTGRAVPQIPIV